MLKIWRILHLICILPLFAILGCTALSSETSSSSQSNAIGPFISTIAGKLGLGGTNGDGGLAINALLNFPATVFIDSGNNIFIADSGNNTIRKVNSSDGTIKTVAGIPGTIGTNGDGGLSTNAKFCTPFSICVDLSNNIYIADTGNNTVRKVNASDGKIHTIAGIPGSNGSTGDGGAAIAAKLFVPQGICVDLPGNIFIADTANNAIRKINISDGKIHTIAGILQANGNIGDGGSATNAKLNNPSGVYVDSIGNIYIADTWNHAIRKVNASDGKINTIAGTLGSSGKTGDGGFATIAKLNRPQGIYVDLSNNIYIADTGNSTVRKVNASDGKIHSIAGIPGSACNSGDGGSAISAGLSNPIGVFADSAGNIIIADAGNNAIRLVK
jgi:sugar lactone lactonase YvrE